MATTFRLLVGYQDDKHPTEIWDVLTGVLDTFWHELDNDDNHCWSLYYFVVHFGGVFDNHDELLSFCRDYLKSAVRVNKNSKRIFVSASGGGLSRKNKGIVARAFCMHMFDECAKRGCSISINIS